ncbi:MAG: hypothetical protein HFE64_05290 [Lachnospiraceae bacterium]|nr:hypothetical protein [Lachnospiraceae bacterium]
MADKVLPDMAEQVKIAENLQPFLRFQPRLTQAIGHKPQTTGHKRASK